MNTSGKKQKKTARLLIVDDHRLVRDGLKTMLNSLKKYITIHIIEAESGEQAINKVNRNQFDIVLMDYQLPGISGEETIYRILRSKPQMKILALSSYEEVAYVQSMTEAGAQGYVLKDIDRVEMLKAIETILAGRKYYCNKIAIKLLEWKENKLLSKNKLDALLTNRQVEVLRLITREMTNEEIALKLSVTKRTVDTHRLNIMNKLKARNTAGLVKAAYRMNLIEDGEVFKRPGK